MQPESLNVYLFNRIYQQRIVAAFFFYFFFILLRGTNNYKHDYNKYNNNNLL